MKDKISSYKSAPAKDKQLVDQHIDDQNLERGQTFKSIFIKNAPNVPNQNNQCNVQINRKAFPSLKVGDVLEISPIDKVSTQPFQTSYLNNSSSQADSEHSTPILLKVVEESLKDDIKIFNNFYYKRCHF